MVAVLNRADLSLHSFNYFTTNGNANLQVDLFSQALMGALLMEAASNNIGRHPKLRQAGPDPRGGSLAPNRCMRMVGESSCTGVS